MYKFVERIFLLYSNFGVNQVFNIDEALDIISQNEDITKQTVRSSLQISTNKGLISIDSKNTYSWAYRRLKWRGLPTSLYKEDSNFIDRNKLKHYDKMKTYYKFSEENLIVMVKNFNLKPREQDITPGIVKYFLTD